MNLYELKGHQIYDLLLKKELKAEEIVLAIINRIEEEDSRINAYITKTYDEAIKTAKEVDKLIENGSPLPKFAGVPIIIKDNICTKGIKTTCASLILSNFIPPYDATVVERIKEHKLPILGKANMDEFAMGSSNENSSFGPVRNPYNLGRVAGGSSGGSAAAVANHEAVVSLGSDTGGSVRQPASFCNVIGLKPTYGLVSRYGLIAFASSFDQIGPIAKDITDIAYLLSIIAGNDQRDATSLPLKSQDYSKYLIEDTNIKLGIPREYFIREGLESDVKEKINKALSLLEEIGMELVEVNLPYTADYSVASYYIIATSEASSNLARYDGTLFTIRKSESSSSINDMYKKTRSFFGKEVKRRIMLGSYALSAGYYDAYYLKAQKVRRIITEEINRAFLIADLIITPTSPTTAFPLGERLEDPLTMYLSDIYTIFANLAGLPAISLPCSFDKERLPIGIQIVAPHLREDLLIKFAYTYQQNLPNEF